MGFSMFQALADHGIAPTLVPLHLYHGHVDVADRLQPHGDIMADPLDLVVGLRRNSKVCV
eukprot:CAMPEP_0114669936 /NCGR_PEP_ID=MMETSP0191-20121206/38801_1 /TAXON_ID=126664 /ORGANISM="Sorites sp." /LENGTH=59 /DNA_ID=CAMNT_0001926567 /DNA_START=45 /DNA_END=221 /DNA_ORIENTATION=-